MNDITYCVTSPYETCKDCERNFLKHIDGKKNYYSFCKSPKPKKSGCPEKLVRKRK